MGRRPHCLRQMRKATRSLQHTQTKGPGRVSPARHCGLLGNQSRPPSENWNHGHQVIPMALLSIESKRHQKRWTQLPRTNDAPIIESANGYDSSCSESFIPSSRRRDSRQQISITRPDSVGGWISINRNMCGLFSNHTQVFCYWV